MAVTVLATVNGNNTGPAGGYNVFNTVIQLGYDSKSGGSYHLVQRYYVYVSKSAGSQFCSSLRTSWGHTGVALSTVGTYADSGWTELGWYSQGSVISLGAWSQYTSNSGVVNNSTANLSYTLPFITYWNDINVYNPSGVQDFKSAYFDLKYSDEGSTRYNLTNEPEPALYKPYGTTMTISNIRPYYEYYELSSVTGAAAMGNGFYRDTIITASHAICIYMKYRTYTVNYDANGGNNAPDTEKFIYTDNFSLSSAVPTREGYNFIGWSLSEDAENAAYMPGDVWEKYSESSYTLYAVWIKVHTVTFDGNGGLVNGYKSVVMNATNGTDITIFPTTTRNYYEFLGWNDEVDGSGTYYDALTITSDLTLYAIWQAESNCYVKVDGLYMRGITYARSEGLYRKAVKIS